MTDRVTVNADRTKLLPPNSPQKGYRITRVEAKELGLLDSAEKPIQQRRTVEAKPPRRTTRKQA